MNAFIVEGVRTAIGNFAGSLAPVRTDDLAAVVLKGILQKHPSLNPAEISDVIMGCANQAGEDNRNVARMALLLADYPV
ncbi:MAG: 3-oxoadipyl-CoA thiolase, partial [Bacteroidetes bacterium]|nr:3-oxoadipyl-CoA thiolase [Bacteroidota bacterium]